MKKTILLLFLLITAFSNSQSLQELEKRNELLIAKKDSLSDSKEVIEKRIDEIEKEIELNKSKIIVQNLKINSTKVLINKNCSFYEKASELSTVIDYPNYKQEIFLIEYYKYGDYYKAIYNDKIGYIKEKDIKSSKSTRNLKRLSSSSNFTSSSLITNKPKTSTSIKRNSYSRTYYRGSRGGCYYINSNGNKTYVDRSLCN